MSTGHGGWDFLDDYVVDGAVVISASIKSECCLPSFRLYISYVPAVRSISFACVSCVTIIKSIDKTARTSGSARNIDINSIPFERS